MLRLECVWLCIGFRGSDATTSGPSSSWRGRLSVQAISWVIDHSQHKLGNLVVLLMVANHARSDGTGAWPSLSTLARECRMSERGVRYCLRILEKSGELLTNRGAGPHGCNLYSLPGANFAGVGGKIMQRGGQNNVKRVSKIAPEPSFNRPLTVKDKERNVISDEAKLRMQKRRDQEQLARLERILRENPNLVPTEQARIALGIEDLKRKLAA